MTVLDWLMVACVVLMMGDAWSTMVVLRLGAVERNRIVKWFARKMGAGNDISAVVLKIAGVAISVSIYKLESWRGLLAVAVIYAAVVGNNIRWIVRYRRKQVS